MDKALEVPGVVIQERSHIPGGPAKRKNPGGPEAYKVQCPGGPGGGNPGELLIPGGPATSNTQEIQWRTKYKALEVLGEVIQESCTNPWRTRNKGRNREIQWRT